MMQDTSSHPTLAKILRQHRPEWSWNDCRRAITAGRIEIGGVTMTDPTARVTSVSEILIKNHGSPHHHASRKEPELMVYHSDDHIIVVEKPSGIESVPFATKYNDNLGTKISKSETVIDIARAWLETKERKKLPPLKIVHRLDKGTSGVMVFARTKLAERELGQLFRRHDIQRRYVAICLGTPQSGGIRSWLVKDRGDGRRGSVSKTSPKSEAAKEAVTHVKLLETKGLTANRSLSMIECQLETGRTHQIRIHLAESGHPLAGEQVYLSPRSNAPAIFDYSNAPRITLHATDLGFRHPVTGANLHWSSPLPADLSNWWRSLQFAADTKSSSFN
jgi:23S rRNA pseudouridine1911/1915/1917 synthase